MNLTNHHSHHEKSVTIPTIDYDDWTGQFPVILSALSTFLTPIPSFHKQTGTYTHHDSE